MVAYADYNNPLSSRAFNRLYRIISRRPVHLYTVLKIPKSCNSKKHTKTELEYKKEVLYGENL